MRYKFCIWYVQKAKNKDYNESSQSEIPSSKLGLALCLTRMKYSLKVEKMSSTFLVAALKMIRFL